MVQPAPPGYALCVDAGRTYELLARLTNLLRSEERRVGQDHGLASVHLHALGYLARANRYSDTATALGEYLGLTKGTTSQTVAVLVERGFVAAQRDPSDSRKQHLAPTEAGRRVLAATRPPDLLQAAVKGLSAEAPPSHGPALERALEELLRAVQRAAGARAFGVCATCRHLTRRGRTRVCGLTGEPLSVADTERICREQELPAAE